MFLTTKSPRHKAKLKAKTWCLCVLVVDGGIRHAFFHGCGVAGGGVGGAGLAWVAGVSTMSRALV